MNKHFIRIDKENNVTNGFSSGINQHTKIITETDICINYSGGKHFELNGQINPPLTDLNGIYLYKYVNGEVFEKTENEKKIELEGIIHPKSELEQLKEVVDMLLIDSLGV